MTLRVPRERNDMYVPDFFSESDNKKIAQLIQTYPFANLITQSDAGMEANSLPFLLHTSDECWILKGHIARANVLWQQPALASSCLVIFQGPQHYISPAWYPDKDTSGGKVVPTWNYASVHLRGQLSFIHDTVWLQQQVAELTQIHEQRVQQNWSLNDAPDTYIQKMLKAIVGIEIRITQIQGKWKVSQNRSKSDKLAVASALRCLGTDDAHAVQQLIVDALNE